jgi:hypothetical protein
MPDVSAFSKLYGRVGRYSRYAGIGFIVLSVLFLVIAVSDQFIVFEIDSIIAFLAALVLLFKDPRARVQARVFDAVMGSTDEAIGELSASDAGFTYVPAGNGVEMVVIVPDGRAARLAARGDAGELWTRSLRGHHLDGRQGGCDPPWRVNIMHLRPGTGEVADQRLCRLRGRKLPRSRRQRGDEQTDPP